MKLLINQETGLANALCNLNSLKGCAIVTIDRLPVFEGGKEGDN